jgi:hypothetical protein
MATTDACTIVWEKGRKKNRLDGGRKGKLAESEHDRGKRERETRLLVGQVRLTKTISIYSIDGFYLPRVPFSFTPRGNYLRMLHLSAACDTVSAKRLVIVNVLSKAD